MYSRGRRMVALVKEANEKQLSDCENGHPNSDEEDRMIYSSNSDSEDPSYIPSGSCSESDGESFTKLMRKYFRKDLNTSISNNNIVDNSVSQESDKKEIGNPQDPSSSDKTISPTYGVVPTIRANKVENVSNTAQDSNIPNRGKNHKYLRKPDYCFYCMSEVPNFGRHICRNHTQELKVQEILSFEPKSIERKRLISSLRKQGNFLKNSESLYKPVHKSIQNNTEENYVPCPYCFGYYSRRLLWKHKKKCPQNMKPGTKISLSEAQNILLPKYKTDSNLRLTVFPRMHADQVSLVAKKDFLICAFGSRYLNIHREQHHVNVCSRKMRELSKVLIESQKINPSIKNLFDLLQPRFFDVVVNSVRIIAKYDPQKDMFFSPTFAMNISKSLKDCCDIAIMHIIKRKYNDNSIPAAEAEANINMFSTLLKSNWKYEISSQAGNDLNTKTWNKTTIVPLAADLKLFRGYLVEKGNTAANDLKDTGGNLNSFNLLVESIFCRLLLLNRKRVGELQRMKLTAYTLSEEKKSNYDEFAGAISPTEQVLLKKFKRIVIRGKRGRGVPVLFSEDMQNHMNILIKVRPQFVPNNNLFLFANTKSDQPIVGYKILQKHAYKCGANNPAALTSTRLRKHLATLTQIFNMTHNDIEQLATFMGHTLNVHSKVYRLPDDVYQTAKIAKILMLMEKGDAAKFKGKSIEEINVDMEEEIGEEMEVVDEEKEVHAEENDINILQQTKETENMLRQTNVVSIKKKREFTKWTCEQKQVVITYFKNHIQTKKPPKRKECDTLIEKYPDLLNNKSWLKIKVFIQNCYTKKIINK